jgi:hypothetical protein
LNKPQQSYDYFVHIATLTGYSCVLPVTRLPEMGESVEDWLQEECDCARARDREAGILYFRDLADTAIVSFHRQPNIESGLVKGRPSPDSIEDETECVGFAKPNVTVITVAPDALPEEEPPENGLGREE